MQTTVMQTLNDMIVSSPGLIDAVDHDLTVSNWYHLKCYSSLHVSPVLENNLQKDEQQRTEQLDDLYQSIIDILSVFVHRQPHSAFACTVQLIFYATQRSTPPYIKECIIDASSTRRSEYYQVV
jgi:hypothetical protein